MKPEEVKAWIEVLKEGKKLLVSPKKEEKIKTSPRKKTTKPKKLSLNGKTIVVTGTISMHRPVFEKKLEKFGGKLGKSITHSTDFLIVGIKPGKIKIKDAQDKKIPIIKWKTFLSMI